MSNTRQTVTRGPGFLTYDSATTPSTTTNVIQFQDDAKIEMVPTNELFRVALQGVTDESRKDFMVKLSGTPLIYPAGQSGLLAWLFPWANGVPVVGTSLFGSSDVPAIFQANNGDAVGLYNAQVVKMPSLTLDIGKPVMGPLEVIALIRNGYDPETANSYYKLYDANLANSISFTPPKLGQNSGDSFGRQRYYGNWDAGGITGFSEIEAQAGWTIDYELELEPFLQQGRTRDYSLSSFRAMAKCIPIGPTMDQIDAAQQNQGSGAKHGSFLSANSGFGNLVIAGQNNVTVTIVNAVLKTAGYVFGGKPLRQGEVGWVGTFNLTTTTYTGGLTLA